MEAEWAQADTKGKAGGARDNKTNASDGAAEGKSENAKQESEQSSEQAEPSKPFDFMEWLGNLEIPKMPTMESVSGMRYYAGGFEEKMTRREAAMILGVRGSADAKRIKTAHRKILIANHPDKGGSPYMSAKINEAKEMLIKGKEGPE